MNRVRSRGSGAGPGPGRRVVLVEPKAAGFHVFSRYKLPRLGLPLLGATLERELGITPKVYFEELSGPDWGELERADLVGISTITPTAPSAYDLLRRIKRSRDVPVVLGGPHVTFMAEEALAEGADYVIRGEGEEAFVELVRFVFDGEGRLEDIAGLSWRDPEGAFHHNPDRPRQEHLSDLPWPNLSLVEGFEKSRIVPVLTSRGCPHDCKFCSVTSMFGRRYRFRDTEDVIAELKTLVERKPKGIYFFYDDNFTASPKHTKELLRRMKEEGVTPRWTAQARVDIARDEELLELMRETNCLFLYLGLESINPATLEAYRKTQTVADIVDGVKKFHEYGIRVHGMFVLGSDEDDRATIRETVKFAKKTGIDTVQFLILTPIPGSEVYDEMVREDRIFVHDWSKYSGHHVVYYPRKMSPFKLQKEASLRAMLKFYSLWQCWKLGMLFRFKDVVFRLYAHRVVSRWKSRNKDYLSDLKARYKQELHELKARYKEDIARRKGKPTDAPTATSSSKTAA